jgi:hypothetical protein
LRDEDALGMGRGAGGILDIGHFVGAERLEFVGAERQGGERVVAEDDGHAGDAGGFGDLRLEIVRGDDGGGASAVEHAGDARDIGVAAADVHGIGQRAGDEAGVLAGEEHDHELRPRLGHDRDAVTP